MSDFLFLSAEWPLLFKPPYTDINAQEPLGVFPSARVEKLVQVQVLDGIGARAVA
jgi:type I restriction enzyme R subunit